MVRMPNSPAATTPATSPRFDALCMALGLSDSDGFASRFRQPQPSRLRLVQAGGVVKGQQQRCKLIAAAAPAAEHGVATSRPAKQSRRCQPLGRPLRPLPAAQRVHAAQPAQPAGPASVSCDSVTSTDSHSNDFSVESRGVMSPILLSTSIWATPAGSAATNAILATGMRLIMSTMSPVDACQLASARSFLAAFPPPNC